MIETERLVLRPQRIDDFERLHALTASEEMHRFLGGPATIEENYRRLLAAIGGWSVFGYDRFTIAERDGGGFVGTCGLFQQVRGLGEDFDRNPEAGWIIASRHWGKGYASEAVRALIEWFERTHGRRRTVCMINRGNAASERIAARFGYREMRAAEYKGAPVILYAREV